MTDRKDSTTAAHAGRPMSPRTLTSRRSPSSSPVRRDYSTFNEDDEKSPNVNDTSKKEAHDTTQDVPTTTTTTSATEGLAATTDTTPAAVAVTAQPTKKPVNNFDSAPTKQKGATATLLRHPEQQETEEWSFRLFGCFEDKSLCLSTFCLPCYTEARNAAYFYEEENEVGVGYCLGLCGVGAVMRWRIRQHKHIEGHMLSDVATHILCPCCALIQENREIYGTEGSHFGERLPILKKK